MYESLFQTRLQKPVAKTTKEKEAVMKSVTEEGEINASNIRKIGPAKVVKQALAKGTGFRLVDMDDFVIGLNNTVFYWMGNNMRSSACCLCFTEVSNADTGKSYTVYNPQESPLVAIGKLN